MTAHGDYLTAAYKAANRLLASVAMPTDVADVLEPLLWFCDELCAGGIDLTQKHFLGQSFVRRAAVERGWWDVRGSPRTETDVWQLHELHRFAKTSGWRCVKGTG